MIRSAASKVMWVGRATVFLIGVAVILALVFGVTSTVSAHTGNRAFLHLGHLNISTKVSTLVGKLATDSALVVKNPSGGSALDLKVQYNGQPSRTHGLPTPPPMKVNSDVKVPKLNADKVDDRSASDTPNPDELLALDSNGQFPASAIPDTAGASITGYEIVYGPASSGSPPGADSLVLCPSGKKTIGGGASIGFQNASSRDGVYIATSMPFGSMGWDASAYEIAGGYSGNWSLRSYVICAHATP